MKPVALAPNLVDHFYRGGDRIGRLRRITPTSDHQPEEWLGSTVSRADDPVAGLARTADGELLRDLVSAAPEAWIGPGFASARNAGDVGILFKLLDARQRLPIHVHPDRDFARRHLHCPYGKTEAWFILEAEPGSAVHLGWREGVDRRELDARRDAQDGEWMLAHMNRIEVTPGMGILVPAGTVHAIDGGIFLTEVQEPTDFSIVLEWSVTTSGREDSHLGLGFDAVMPAVSTEPLSADDLSALIARTDLTAVDTPLAGVLPPAADPFFRLLHAAPGRERSAEIPAGFAVVLVLDGDGRAVGQEGSLPLSSGAVLAVPHGFGPWRIEGDARVLIGAPGAGWPATLAG